MSRRAKWTLGLTILVVVVGGLFALAAAKKGSRATEVRLEAVSARDLVATVTASGRIEAKTKVDISADITGRITQIAVREGDHVKKGQFLLQIEPDQYLSIVSRLEGQVASAEAGLAQARANRDQARRSRDRSVEIQRVNAELIARETVEQAIQAYDVAEANFPSARAGVEQARAALAEAGFRAGADVEAYQPIGCARCNQSGYRGRIGLFSVMSMSEKIKDLTVSGAAEAEITRTAREEGMATLREDGLAKVRSGVTSIEEVSRVSTPSW